MLSWSPENSTPSRWMGTAFWCWCPPSTRSGRARPGMNNNSARSEHQTCLKKTPIKVNKSSKSSSSKSELLCLRKHSQHPRGNKIRLINWMCSGSNWKTRRTWHFLPIYLHQSPLALETLIPREIAESTSSPTAWRHEEQAHLCASHTWWSESLEAWWRLQHYKSRNITAICCLLCTEVYRKKTQKKKTQKSLVEFCGSLQRHKVKVPTSAVCKLPCGNKDG